MKIYLHFLDLSLLDPEMVHVINPVRLSDAQMCQQTIPSLVHCHLFGANYNMIVWILARNDINFSMAAGLIRLHMPGVK